MADDNRQRVLGFLIVGGIIALVVSTVNFDRNDLRYFILVIPTIILHEIAHGAVAFLFGDDTAKRAKRLTLNPIRHIDPFGTILLPALLAFSGLPPFGYAKPVPVNTSKLRNERVASLLVSLAGPGTNLLLAVLAGIGANAAFGVDNATLAQWWLDFAAVNIFLGMFNLIPIPPLDGSAILELFIPLKMKPGYYKFRRYAMFGLLALLLLGGTLTSRAIAGFQRPAVRAYANYVCDLPNSPDAFNFGGYAVICPISPI